MNPAAIQHRHIEVFRAVMSAGNVSEAARQLHSSQPTLSRELARLEYLLGFALFERVRGRLRPTQRGLALFDEVQRSFQGLERISSRALELAQGGTAALELLCLPALSQALLPGACVRLQRLAPEARLNITPQEPPLLDEWLSAQRFDLGLTELAAAPAGTSSRLLFSADEVGVLPEGHPLLAKPVLQAADFAGQPFISLAPSDPYRQQIDRLFAEHGVGRDLRLQTHSAAAICELVRRGLGLSIINPLSALSLAGHGLHLRRLALSIPYQVYLAQPLLRASHARLEPLQQALHAEAEDLQQRLSIALQA
ncbi:LysR family transcriptional regulator [Paucibacter sp. APW11]|uniref:LysR family transcriptional regulator n=1 Tax=Roseateles aquae TaxID=3077235 RepID=A0ABU3PD45_9BURK|nr:LysR family transcriptional regulator [Paucibacter sp. APW11]MDT9000504.1 LysR family transcriptional regulator [Paucibacter sp. APW11]